MRYTWKQLSWTNKRYAPSKLREAFRFHVEWSGMIVGENAKSALALARAEMRARELDLTFTWLPDDDADMSFVETWTDKEQEAWHKEDHFAECCLCQDPHGKTLASLSGIVDATAEYRRTVEAELALEAIGEFDESENLDGLSICPFDLEAYAEDTSKPEALRNYAACKSAAMMARLTGKVELALAFERTCETIYSLLPYHLKW